MEISIYEELRILSAVLAQEGKCFTPENIGEPTCLAASTIEKYLKSSRSHIEQDGKSFIVRSDMQESLASYFDYLKEQSKEMLASLPALNAHWEPTPISLKVAENILEMLTMEGDRDKRLELYRLAHEYLVNSNQVLRREAQTVEASILAPIRRQQLNYQGLLETQMRADHCAVA